MAEDAPCQYLDWDSVFFGCRVARVRASQLDESQLANVLDWCEKEAIDWLHLLADSAHARTPRLAQRAGFDLVDVRMEMGRALTPARYQTSPLPPGNLIRPAVNADVPSLRQIAGSAHRDTRFFFDLNLPAGQAEAMYATWIERSVIDGRADAVLVAESHDRIVAYITGQIQPATEGRIALLAVEAGARGRGIGAALVQAMLAIFVARDLRRARVVTQGRNISAQRLYQRQGFVSESVWLWYHKHFER